MLSMLGIWLFYVIVNTAQAAIDGIEHQFPLIGRRVIVAGFGASLTFMLYLVLQRFEARRISVRLAVAFLVSVPLSVLLSMFNYYSFIAYFPVSFFKWHPEHLLQMRRHPIASIAGSSLDCFFFFACWAAIYTAFAGAVLGRRAELQAAHYRTEARSAELRALRYQLNPHFLFNTLNSLSALVMRGTPDQAEQMIETLSAFLRTTLIGDPSEDTTLAEELQVQRLYLDIEQVRFPDRLRVRIDIPPRLEAARIPGLLLQPLVENALKYGVARSIQPVTITVCAHDEGNLLHIEVQDDGASSVPSQPGTGVGLRNVAARLKTRYGDAARLTYGKGAEGGFRVELTLPLEIVNPRGDPS